MIKGRHYRAVERAVTRHWVDHFTPPTLRDIQAATGITSSSVVAYTLRQIESIDMMQGHPVPTWISDAIREAAG